MTVSYTHLDVYKRQTLCNLIARFWDVQGGRITVGGHDVREYKLDSLMRCV